MPQEQTLLLYLLNFIIFSIMLLPYGRAYSGKLFNESCDFKKVALIFGILYVINATFAFYSTDFWNYLPHILVMTQTHEAVHVEPTYFWILKNVGYDYLLWRFVIWTAAIVVTIITFIRYKVDLRVALLFFSLLYVNMSITMRGSLGVAMMFLGCSLIMNEGEPKKKTILLGFAIIVASYFFHRSMFLAIAMMGVMMIKIRPSWFVISIIVFPLLYSYIPQLISYVMDMGIELENDEMNLSRTLQTYGEDTRAELNLNGWIALILQYSGLVIAFFYMSKQVIFKKELYPKHIKGLYNYWYGMFYLGSLFFYQDTSHFLSTRFFLLGYLPMVIVLAYDYQIHNHVPKGIKLTMFFSFVWFLFKNFVAIYQLL